MKKLTLIISVIIALNLQAQNIKVFEGDSIYLDSLVALGGTEIAPIVKSLHLKGSQAKDAMKVMLNEKLGQEQAMAILFNQHPIKSANIAYRCFDGAKIEDQKELIAHWYYASFPLIWDDYRDSIVIGWGKNGLECGKALIHFNYVKATDSTAAINKVLIEKQNGKEWGLLNEYSIRLADKEDLKYY